ncbi:MAG: hypothetical protein M3R36_18090 [Bacteroidota bacterium]|nr:hypothetical protein [Bacteroidota bacterium]
MNTLTKNKKQINKRKNILEYVTDEKGIKTKVIIPISVYENLLEDLHDIAIVAERKNEGYITFDTVIKGLNKDGLL